MEIINERPEGMIFEDYQKLRRKSVNELRQYLKGTTFHKAVTTTESKTGRVTSEKHTFTGRCDEEKLLKQIKRSGKNGQ